MIQKQIVNHSNGQSIFLHLLPGFLISIFCFLIRPTVINFGYPAIFALVLAVMFILIPTELGYLLYQGKRKTGHFTLAGIINFKRMTPWWQHLVLALFVFGAMGGLMALLKPSEVFLKAKLFFWIPDLANGLDGNYSKAILTVTYILYLIFVVTIGPMVEELYFRGFLLPRMKGRYAVLIHSLLFAIYHFFTPWMIISRTVSFLPLIFVAKKKSIFTGMIVHILCNSTIVISAVVFIMNMK